MTAGRFRSPLHPRALAFSSSLDVDKSLYREDIQGSIAHASMLARQGIISRKEFSRISRALGDILKEIGSGKFAFDGRARFSAEDIHMAIEARLIQKLGPLGGKLHTARSRNDQVSLDERLYLRSTIGKIQAWIRNLQRVFVRKADKYQNLVVPGYTHLQQAQPILLAHHLLAYCSMLERDFQRFADCLGRANRSPLGAGALAGTSFPIDRSAVARMLKLGPPVENSIDAVSDRDFIIEFLAACAMTMMHLSRFAEEMVLWSSQEWHFAEIGEGFTTGSSIMPQKQNPDMAELIRGKTGRVYGSLIALLTTMKGLPLAYNRDLQEDKEPLFDAARTLADCLEISALMLGSTKFREREMDDLLLATELADDLVRRGMPFRKAHAVVGDLIRSCVRRKKSLRSLTIEEFRKHSRLFDDKVFKIIDPRESVRRKRSSGSTSPSEVKKAIRLWKTVLSR